MCTFAAAKRGVAQLVAFLVWDQAVAGSSPVAPTKVETIVLNFSTIVFYSSFFSNHPRLWKVRESAAGSTSLKRILSHDKTRFLPTAPAYKGGCSKI